MLYLGVKISRIIWDTKRYIDIQYNSIFLNAGTVLRPFYILISYNHLVLKSHEIQEDL